MNYKFNRSWLLILLLLVIVVPLLVQAEAPVVDDGPVTVLQSDDGALRLKFRQPTPKIEDVTIDGRVWQQVSLAGFETSRVENAPALPVKELTVALPVGAVAEVAVISAETHTLPNITPLPAPEKVLISYDASDPDSIPEFEDRYPTGSRSAQAGALVELSEPYNVRDYRMVDLQVRPVQPQSSGVLVYDGLTVEVTFSYPEGKPARESIRPESAAFAGLINPINADAAQNWRSVPRYDVPNPSPCLGNDSYRISIVESGIYKLALDDLSSPSGTIETVKMCYDDQEIAVFVNSGAAGQSDYVLFYGESITDREARLGEIDATQDTDTNVYWLTFESGTRKRVAPLQTGSGGTAVTSYAHTTRHETDGRYEPLIPLDDLSILTDDHDHWFWESFGFNSSLPDSVSDTFALTNRVAGTPVTGSAEVWGRNENEHHRAQLDIGGQKTGEATFAGSGVAGARRVLNGTVTPAANPSTIVASVEALDSNSGDGTHLMLLNWIALTYERALQAVNGQLLFTQPDEGNWSYNVSGFSGQTFVFDVTDVYDPAMLTLAGTTFNPSETATVFPATYALATATSGLQPAEIVKDSASNLRGSNSADYIIVTDPSLQSALTPLIALRQSKGLTVKTVYVQDIFDEFGFGRYSPTAIRDFLEYAYTNWSGTPPSYVLLAGDASYDHRDMLGKNNGRNLVPVFLHSGIDKFIGEAASDNQYVAFSDTMDYGRLPSLHLGRLPASSLSEMQTLVGKVVSYEASAFAIDQHGSQLFISDNAKRRSGTTCINDPAGNFFNISNRLIADYAVPNAQIVNRLFYADCHQDDTPYPDHYEASILTFQSKFLTMVEEGQGFVTYVGHAGTRRWADESIITLSQAKTLRNSDKLTIMLPLTCLEGQYHRFDLTDGNNQPVEGMSETLLKNPNGGAVASYAPTGLAVATGHDYLWEGFNEHIFELDKRIIGQAVFGAKDHLPSNTYIDLHDTFVLLGDPAMELKVWDAQSIYLPLIKR